MLEVTLLYDAPTVIEFGFLPGLPMVPKPGPLLPAAVTTTIPWFTALFTLSSIILLVLFTPRLMLMISALSIIACSIALTIRSDETDSPVSETL